MRYDTAISYQNKRINIKVTNKAYSGTYELPEFLRAVRIAKGHDFSGASKAARLFEPHECESFESGSTPITQEYLTCFALGYTLPQKIRNLGIPKNGHVESPLATRLRELRLKENLTQEQCAAKINVGRSTYSLYEIGKNVPDLATLIKIANVYGVSLDYLSGRYN